MGGLTLHILLVQIYLLISIYIKSYSIYLWSPSAVKQASTNSYMRKSLSAVKQVSTNSYI